MFTKMKGLGVLIQKCFNHTRVFQYTQGQSPKLGIREYFYYIDHQGMVSLPKTCFNLLVCCVTTSLHNMLHNYIHETFTLAVFG